MTTKEVDQAKKPDFKLEVTAQLDDLVDLLEDLSHSVLNNGPFKLILLGGPRESN